MLAFVLSVSEFFGNVFYIKRDAIYAQTYPIFVLSWPCQLVVNICVERLLRMPFGITFPLTLVAGIIGPIIIIYLVDQFESKINIKFISKMIGR